MIKFGLVGFSGTILDFGILALLKSFGMPTLPANTFSYSMGIINNYLWNRRWTFEADAQPWLLQFLRFALTSIIGLMFNNLIVLFLEFTFNGFQLTESQTYIPAKIVATIAVFFWNYFANKIWTFKEIPQEA